MGTKYFVPGGKGDDFSPHAQGRHFNFFLGGQNFLKFFNATGLLQNWKKTTLYMY